MLRVCVHWLRHSHEDYTSLSQPPSHPSSTPPSQYFTSPLRCRQIPRMTDSEHTPPHTSDTFRGNYTFKGPSLPLETVALAMGAVAAEAPSRTAQEQCRTVQARSLRVHRISVSNHILYHLLYLSVNKRSTWDWDWARVHASLRNRAHESARDTNRDRLTKSVPMRGDAIECRWLWVWETKQHDRSK